MLPVKVFGFEKLTPFFIMPSTAIETMKQKQNDRHRDRQSNKQASLLETNTEGKQKRKLHSLS